MRLLLINRNIYKYQKHRNNMKNKHQNLLLFFGAFAVLLFLAFIVTSSPSPNVVSQTQGLHHGDHWCTQILRADGTLESPVCGENTYTNAGKNATRDYLWGTAGANFDYLALGNKTATSSTSTTLDGEYAGGGLQRAQGTIYNLAQAGNVTVSKTFTSTANNLLVNTTALFNATSGGTLFAGFSFTSATLQTGDKIIINATIWSS